MKNLTFLLALLSAVSIQVRSQVFPKEGSRLHYRIIGFSFPEGKNVQQYSVELAKGNCDDVETFKKNVFAAVPGPKNRIVAEVPSFGESYSWRICYSAGDGKQSYSGVFHFSTLPIPESEINNYRLRVITAAKTYKDGYVFIDGHGVLYDMQGNPVWFVPKIDSITHQNPKYRDIKISPQGTITLMVNDDIYEINYDGDVLWKGPDNVPMSNATSEKFHHEFTRLSNGHYMALGNEELLWNHPMQQTKVIDRDNPPAIPPRSNQPVRNPKTQFGTVIEFDEHGDVVWIWKSSNYIMSSDIAYFASQDRAGIIDAHENAFYFDEKDSLLYISFRNVSRILKVKYPSGEVIKAYGEVFMPNIEPKGNGLFCSQHSCRYSDLGYLYLFNNNACAGDGVSLPEIIKVRESDCAIGGLEEIWKYQFTADGILFNPRIEKVKEKMYEARINRGLKAGHQRMRPTSGGNVIELPDQSIFAAMNVQYGKVLIVNKKKEINWAAIPEKYDIPDHKWYNTPIQYRASMITNRKQFEILVWNAQ